MAGVRRTVWMDRMDAERVDRLADENGWSTSRTIAEIVREYMEARRPHEVEVIKGRIERIDSAIKRSDIPPVGSVPPCPYNDIVELYHQILPQLPKVRAVKGLKPALSARWRESRERQRMSWWEDFFRNKISTSDFLMGRVKSFKANLGWIVGQKNFTNIMNGQYDTSNDN